MDTKGGHPPTHVEEIAAEKAVPISHSELLEAKHDALADSTRSVWQVILDNKKSVLVTAIVQLNGFILGMEYVYLGALVGVQAFDRTMGHYDAATKSYAIDAWILSLWAGLFGLMQFLGQLFAGWFSDRFGRTKAIYAMVLLVYLGVMTEVLSHNRYDYTGAKIIMGAATGMMQVVIPSYVAEIAPRETRGISVGSFSFFLSLGALVGNVVTFMSNKRWGANPLNNLGWKVPLYVGLATPTLVLIGMLLVVCESPYWLALNNRFQDAQRSLQKLHPTKSTEEIERMLHEVEYTILKERAHKESTKDATYWECLTGPNLKRTFAAAFPSCIQSYSTYFFGIAGLGTNSLKGSLIVSSLSLAAAIVAFFLIDQKRVGRWILVFVGALGMTVSMLGVGITDSAAGDSAAAGQSYVAMLAIFNAMASIGPGVVGWAYAGEIGSARLRAKTTTLATGSNAIIGTITNIVIPLELAAIGPKTGYMFFGLGVICSVLIYIWVPDITGRTYAQMDELFERRIPSRKFASTVCTGDYGKQLEVDAE